MGCVCDRESGRVWVIGRVWCDGVCRVIGRVWCDGRVWGDGEGMV